LDAERGDDSMIIPHFQFNRKKKMRKKMKACWSRKVWIYVLAGWIVATIRFNIIYEPTRKSAGEPSC